VAGVGVSLAEATYATTTATITSGMTARPSEALARVCRAAWRLEQAGRERAWALASALAEGAPIRPLAGAWLVRTARFAAMKHAARFRK
jgi:hypothetical protein